jgi:uncharacterized protein (TIGR00288 family)
VSNPQAALLIDFDNVTMGIRSDLTKELKNLLNSDVIKGKVAVQRAYADWRRYPQYIVPLAEASVDLIFAPAYGSVKKNATDIRLAIDALELVFTRPEIGTYILLSGDSDFSSLVLKLKEYGKYVVGVGIRESASDLLVQNCDEYYSYSVLTGLTRAGDESVAVSSDPWELVELAVRQMQEAKDVMRSDRLKQVLLELDANFDEKTLGFSKFNRFVQEAANRGLLNLQKLDNGQFELSVPGDEPAEAAARREEDGRSEGRRGRSRRGRGRREERREERREDEPREPEPAAVAPAAVPAAEVPPAPPVVEPVPARAVDGLDAAYALLRRAVGDVARSSDAARDSDVKRRILEIEPGWDESALGFSKFSRFLRQAHDADVVNLRMLDNGSYEVALGEFAEADGAGAGRASGRPESRQPAPALEPKPERTAPASAAPAPRPPVPPERTKPEPVAEAAPAGSVAQRTLGLRRGSGGRAAPKTPPPLLEGQTVPSRRSVAEPSAPARTVAKQEDPAPVEEKPPARERRAPAKKRDVLPDVDPVKVGYPTQAVEVVTYLATHFKGVGQKMAESLIDAFGANGVFRAMLKEPDRVRKILGEKRGEKLLSAWHEDYRTRAAAAAEGSEEAPAESAEEAPARARKRGRRGGRRRKGSAAAAE